jgi:hypothetical protein
MRRLRSVVALVILVVTNAFVFGGILWNRSGEATGTIMFDQCELNSFDRWAGRHGTPRYVALIFESQEVDEGGSEDLRWYDGDGKHLARRVYVVAKHGGPEWQEFVERRRRPGRYSDFDSRLILVDGGNDPETLLGKYPEAEGRAILPGYVGGRYWYGSDSQSERWHSVVGTIAIDSRYRGIVKDIRDARRALERATRDGRTEYVKPPCFPTHRIMVKWGRRFEPWISSIEPL